MKITNKNLNEHVVTLRLQTETFFVYSIFCGREKSTNRKTKNELFKNAFLMYKEWSHIWSMFQLKWLFLTLLQNFANFYNFFSSANAVE